MENSNDSSRGDAPDLRRKSRVPLIVGLIVGAAILLLLACGGAVYWFFSGLNDEIPLAEAGARAFLNELRANRVEAAYAQTSSVFRANTSEEQFRAHLNKFPAFTNHGAATFAFQRIFRGTGGTNATFVATLIGANARTSCQITLVKEDDVWRVYRVDAP
jgi:hypothetical protein